MVVLTDELLDRLAFYYTHEMIEKCIPYLREIPFEVFVERELLRMGTNTTSSPLCSYLEAV